jgi:hypothetical protein
MYYVLVVVHLSRLSHTLEKVAGGGTEFHKAKKPKVMRIGSFFVVPMHPSKLAAR